VKSARRVFLRGANTLRAALVFGFAIHGESAFIREIRGASFVAARTRRVGALVFGFAIHAESAFIREIRGLSFFAAIGFSAAPRS